MDGDHVRDEHSWRAKKRIRDEGAGEEKKESGQRPSCSKSRPGNGMCLPSPKQDCALFNSLRFLLCMFGD